MLKILKKMLMKKLVSLKFNTVVGASYVPAENILATIEYFDGKDMDTDTDASKFFANVDFFF